MTGTSYARLFGAVGKKRLLLLKRYPANTLSQLAGVLVFFALIFFGGRAVAGSALTDSLGGIVVGFFLYTMAVTAFFALAYSVTRESQWGTLEQLYMSPYGFGRLMTVKVTVNVLESFAWGGVTLAFMLALTGETLALDPVTVVPLVVLALVPAVGVGFVIAGVAMLYKRIENAYQLVSFGFIAVVAAPAGQYPLLKLLPVTQGSYLLRRAMVDGTALWNLPASELAVLAGVALAYFTLGYAVFAAASRRARRKGLLGHY